jgi:hypothetical protein
VLQTHCSALLRTSRPLPARHVGRRRKIAKHQTITKEPMSPKEVYGRLELDARIYQLIEH